MMMLLVGRRNDRTGRLTYALTLINQCFIYVAIAFHKASFGHGLYLSSEKCLSAEISDAYRKRVIARKGMILMNRLSTHSFQ
jgi:hypothetical protein